MREAPDSPSSIHTRGGSSIYRLEAAFSVHPLDDSGVFLFLQVVKRTLAGVMLVEATAQGSSTGVAFRSLVSSSSLLSIQVLEGP